MKRSETESDSRVIDRRCPGEAKNISRETEQNI